MDNNKVIVRFPPSPTGLLQMGNVRTLLYNYLFARKNNGKILLRIEDTDKERSSKEYEEEIYKTIEWLWLDYDNHDSVWHSSQRLEVYKDKIQELLKKGCAYISEEQTGENKEVVRFRNPGGKIKFIDLIRGEIEIDINDLGDFIIARNIDDPLYHLAVCVDDALSGITHIIRGDDHISNTPRQILILEALGLERPIYAHLPLVLAPDKTKLSKRKHGETVSLKYYREQGYSPEAVINFLAMIGWNPGTDQEVFNLEELIQAFDLEKVQKKGGVFNVEKLDWFNREHILKETGEQKITNFKSEVAKSKWASHSKFNDPDFETKFLNLVLERIHRWGEVGKWLNEGEYDYLFERPDVDLNKLGWKTQNKEEVIRIMNHELSIMEEEKNEEKMREKITELAQKEGKGQVFWPLRYALSSREKSPDPFSLISLLGTKESTDRIKSVLNTLTLK